MDCKRWLKHPKVTLGLDSHRSTATAEHFRAPTLLPPGKTSEPAWAAGGTTAARCSRAVVLALFDVPRAPPHTNSRLLLGTANTAHLECLAATVLPMTTQAGSLFPPGRDSTTALEPPGIVEDFDLGRIALKNGHTLMEIESWLCRLEIILPWHGITLN